MTPATAASLLLAALVWLLDVVVRAEVCPTSGTARPHSCPDFRDDDLDKFCCPSSTKGPGEFYCCNAAKLRESEDARRSAQWRAFFSKYLVLIVCVSLALIILVVSVILLVCYKQRDCPLARRKRDRRKKLAETRAAVMTSSFTSRYRPVETSEPKPANTAHYEAPPPYPFPQLAADMETAAMVGTDWHCLLQNAENGERAMQRQQQQRPSSR